MSKSPCAGWKRADGRRLADVRARPVGFRRVRRIITPGKFRRMPSARGEFPFGFGRQPLAGRLAKRRRRVPRDEGHRKLASPAGYDPPLHVFKYSPLWRSRRALARPFGMRVDERLERRVGHFGAIDRERAERGTVRGQLRLNSSRRFAVKRASSASTRDSFVPIVNVPAGMATSSVRCAPANDASEQTTARTSALS